MLLIIFLVYWTMTQTQLFHRLGFQMQQHINECSVYAELVYEYCEMLKHDFTSLGEL